MLKAAFLHSCCWIAFLCVGISRADNPDPIPPLLTQLQSASAQTRLAAFEQLLSLGGPILGPVATALPLQIHNLIAANRADAPSVTSSLVALLAYENSPPATNINDLPADETYADYYADVIAAVVTLNTPQSIPALIGAIETGNLATQALASFGKQSLGPVLVVAYDPNVQRRDAAAFTFTQMLQPSNRSKVNDQSSLSMIRAGLQTISASFDADHAYMKPDAAAGLNLLPRVPEGDLNGDGATNCADLKIVISAFHTRLGEQRFDLRADLNGNGRIGRRDLQIEVIAVGKSLAHSRKDWKQDFWSVIEQCLRPVDHHAFDWDD